MSVSEYEHEPVRGLPDHLPAGEQLVWRGGPAFWPMAKQVFHLRSVAIYFALLIAIHAFVQLSRGAGITDVVLGGSWMLGLGVTAIAILALLAWAYTRTTVYTLTNRRLVLRFGVAMPMMVNIPLPVVTSADMRQRSDGSGDIVLSLQQKKRPSYVMLWPNVRPWKFNPVQPAMRSLADVESAATALARVVSEASRDNPEQEITRVDGGVADSEPQLGDSRLVGAS